MLASVPMRSVERHQVDVERLGLAGEVGERLAQHLDDRRQLLLALGRGRVRVSAK